MGVFHAAAGVFWVKQKAAGAWTNSGVQRSLAVVVGLLQVGCLSLSLGSCEEDTLLAVGAQGV